MKAKKLADHKKAKRIDKLPNYVKEGIKRGQEQGKKGFTKSTDEVMKKYKTS